MEAGVWRGAPCQCPRQGRGRQVSDQERGRL